MKPYFVQVKETSSRVELRVVRGSHSVLIAVPSCWEDGMTMKSKLDAALFAKPFQHLSFELRTKKLPLTNLSCLVLLLNGVEIFRPMNQMLATRLIRRITRGTNCPSIYKKELSD